MELGSTYSFFCWQKIAVKHIIIHRSVLWSDGPIYLHALTQFSACKIVKKKKKKWDEKADNSPGVSV